VQIKKGNISKSPHFIYKKAIRENKWFSKTKEFAVTRGRCNSDLLTLNSGIFELVSKMVLQYSKKFLFCWLLESSGDNSWGYSTENISCCVILKMIFHQTESLFYF
jgi:hypothetical protein